ncbi:MAG: hypothetical protein HOF63_00585 [Thiotrichales bacterium]|jgi:hypothetical protein|nr:hypothetical protein [Thiotrichales bacterium]MBT3854087.1 hypothetical protein [Thiotrichales bacterium]MBT4652974.1 hypothetical protein [Thiotrichales bacterium]MBT5984781.1 hypothetical protein [Thiotrichales bacterium]MBT6771015.1 hypothetical protein [Thiotrichales bacterium]
MDNQDYKLNSSFSYLVILAVLIALGVAGRLLPHPPNFTPMAAIALFAGFIFVKRYMAIIAVIVTMLLCDYFAFGSLSASWFASKSMFVVYLALLFPIIFKNFLQKKLGVLRVTGAALASSSVFFIATNFAVWAFSPMYAKTFEGLVLCYTMAIPFFQNTIAGDLIWSGAIFGAYLALRNYSNLQIFNQKDSLIFN